MKKLLRNLLVVAAAFTLSCQISYAQIIPYVASIHTPYQGTAVTIGQPNAAFALQAAFPSTNEQDIQVLNRISLEVD